ncbi:AhpC/TSA antioxidant enzyme-domain-containing protein [Fomitopsis betulina]|nr:AhpC/TSA antioxidant enzyme-domain-containing protein [Fomitopsis betulina]
MHAIPPTGATLAEIANHVVYDWQGRTADFGALIRDQKTVVAFIRHFFCGSCQQQYVTQLAQVKPESLQQAGVRIVVIGCGEWQLIQNYRETTGFIGDVYANPSRSLYKALGLVENLQKTPAGQNKRSYLKKGLLSNIFQSIMQGPLKSPLHIGKQGDIQQNGGEFVFGPGETCSFASRMRHTEDHVEVADLLCAAGVTFE